MFKIKTSRIFYASCITLLMFPFNNVFADAPFITTDPEILSPLNANLTLYGTADKSTVITTYEAPALELDLGLFKNAELDVYLPYTTDVNAEQSIRDSFPNAAGIGDIELNFKYQFIHESNHVPSVAFVPEIYVPTGDFDRGLGNGRVWYALPLSVEKSFGDWTTYGEVGYAYNGAPNFRNFLFAGWVLEKEITQNTSLGGELYYQGATANFTKAYTVLNLGGSHQLTKDVNLIASIGHNIAGENHFIAYLGLTWSV